MHKCNLHQNYKTVSTESGEAILKLILRIEDCNLPKQSWEGTAMLKAQWCLLSNYTLEVYLQSQNK